MNVGTPDLLFKSYYCPLECLVGIAHARIYKGNGYKLSAQRLLGSFGRTSVTCDWLMVALNTIDQS